MLPSALTFALLALGAPVGQQPAAAPNGVTAQPADVVWRYDTGG